MHTFARAVLNSGGLKDALKVKQVEGALLSHNVITLASQPKMTFFH